MLSSVRRISRPCKKGRCLVGSSLTAPECSCSDLHADRTLDQHVDINQRNSERVQVWLAHVRVHLARYRGAHVGVEVATSVVCDVMG